MSADSIAKISSSLALPAPEVRLPAKRPMVGPEGVSKAASGQKAGQDLPVTGSDVPQATADERAISEAVKRISDYVQTVQRSLEFAIDEESGRTVITVRDSDTKEVVRQIPPETILQVSRSLEEEINGLLFSTQA